MAKAIKGCMNEACIACKEKMNFSYSNSFCPKCGQPLFHVCKDCRMKLEDDTRRYCVRCENKRRDDREQLGKILAGKIGEGAKLVGDFAVDTGKKAAKAAGELADDVFDGAERLIEKRKEKKGQMKESEGDED